jgi:hypothetical protein
MNDYFAPDFKFIPYCWPLQPRNRDDFLLGLAARHSSYEKLTPEDITIDETRKVVVVLIKFEAIDRKTGEILAKERGLLHYQLVFDENNAIKINKIQFFREYLPPGTITVFDALKGGKDLK